MGERANVGINEICHEPVEFCTRGFPESGTVSAFQDTQAVDVNMNTPSCLDQSSFIEMAEQLLPNLRVCAAAAAAIHLSHGHDHAPGESNNNLILLMPLDGMAVLGEENNDPVCCQAGEALLIPADLICQVYIADTVSIAIIDIPATLAVSRDFNPGGHQIRKVASASMPELRLLIGYTRMLIQMGDDLSLSLVSLVSTQIHDLVTLLFGTKREEAQVAGKCSLRAVRLEAIKRDILEHLSENELSISQVALRQGISPQYIRTLFHNEDTTFADYVTGLRLEQAYQHLCNPLYIDYCISTLAFNLGFNNLSWFNRAFKQRFGLTPSEAKNLSRQSADQP
ncbi:helix-turn-helix domain-containing protein [Betaproteobacteria bacterium PRO4]|nr:helix-turn-helix domain-containing protein [Betaproteobacteria bacterium PRO4]